jgi:DNA-binding GntR family transcriptional regulator
MSVALSISFAEAEPIARQVLRVLRHAIVTMRIKPGEMLSEQDVATRMGVSRQPVREAFIKLSEAGLMRILPQRGTLVVKISSTAVEDARFVREAVECALAREAALRAPRSILSRLSDNLARQKRAERAKDPEAFFSLDEEFHRLLAEAAGRPSAWRIVEDVKPQMDRVRFLSMPNSTPMKVLIDQHRGIADAVKEGDPDAAEAGMRAHLHEILRSLPRLSELHPDLFEDMSSHAQL